MKQLHDPADLKAVRILHLEDSETDAALVKKALSSLLPCEITHVAAKDSYDCALDDTTFDLILCDYNLPGYDGASALIRAIEKQPGAPVIILSGSMGEEAAVECLKGGATDYVLKERLHRLVPAMRRALREADERRQRLIAENALRESEERFRLLAENSTDMVSRHNSKGIYLYASPSCRVLLGYESAELIGRSAYDFFHPDDLKIIRESHRNIMNEKESHAVSYRIRRKDGQYIWFETISHVVRRPEKGAVEIQASSRDISARKLLEDQLRQSQKMEAIGQLAGGIAHDFNNLLTVINGRSQLLISRLPPGDKIRSEVELIYKTGERAAALTSQLLAFSRKQVLEPKVLDLNAVVADLERMVQRLINEDIVLSTFLNPALKRVKADRGQIEQVLINLVVNSRDAMEGGGQLSIETSNAELDLAYCRAFSDVTPGAYSMLAVRDTGSGMDDSVKAHLFEPFFTTKEPGKGTGMGLSTVFGIVKQSGGHIDVSSEVGKGTTFKVYLPQTDEVNTEKSSGTFSAVQNGHGVVLVVEDEEEVREFIRDILGMNGYTVLIACNGEEALSICNQANTIDLVLTDVVMPKMGGPELAQRIQTVRPGARILFTSGYTHNALVAQSALDASVNFIRKPFTPYSLVQKIRDVVARK